MKKRWPVIALMLTILAMAFCGCSRMDHGAAELPQLHVGVTVYSPYFYHDRNGEMVGVDYEIIEEACKRIGYTPVFHEISIDARFNALKNGEVDCLWSCLSMNDIENAYQWAGPYLYTRRVMMVSQNSDIYRLEELNGAQVGVQAYSITEYLLLDNPGGKYPVPDQVVSVSTVDELFTLLRKGYVDAIGGPEGALWLYAKDYPGEYRDLNIRREKLGVAFTLDHATDVPEKLTAVFDDMTKEGFIGQVLEKYNLDVSENLYSARRLGD